MEAEKRNMPKSRIGHEVTSGGIWPRPTSTVVATKSPSLRYANGWVKQAFDFVAGLSFSILTLPLVVVLALGSAVSFRAWPFFTQTRLGRHGRHFRLVKLRTLPTKTPSDANKYELAEIETKFFGRFLRNMHLDELPQFWLLVTGRMSLVGPRPEMPTLAATFDPDFVAERVAVRPGITGTWQVSPAAARLIGEAPEYDRFYIEHACPRLDAWISVRTMAGFVGLPPLSIEQFRSWAHRYSATARPVPGIERTAAELQEPST
jgi:lipopolysaccharide/colanic/teichoic acid biosynthesis glycosyltransferase